MSKLWLIGLAASAAWTPAATAQNAPPAPPPPPPPAVHGAHVPGAPVMHPGMHHPMPMPRGGMKGFHRFGRGHVVPPHFRGGQFIVHDWRAFGWPAPMPGGHWIRFHDDALLIDGHGRVVDERYGWDWDGRGGHMAHHDDDDRDGGWDPGEDYERGGWDEEGHHGKRRHHGKGDRMVRVYRYGDGYKGDCRRSCARVRHLPPPPPPYPYGYGYGYGMGCGCGPVVVTETITTTAPVVEKHVYYETVREHRVAPRRHYSKPVVRHYVKPARRSVKAAPAPRPGERG